MIPLLVVYAIFLFGTGLSLVPSNVFIFKVWNYFRPQLFVFGALVSIATLFMFILDPTWMWGSSFVVALLATGYHLYKIRRHLPFAKYELDMSPAGEHKLSVMSVNVRQSNKDTDRLIQKVRQMKPDILLVFEIDDHWAKDLHTLKDILPHQITECRQDTYGMGVYSTLNIESHEKLFYCDTAIPALDCLFKDGQGKHFRLLGIHPRPPGEELTGECFQKYLSASLMRARSAQEPIIVAGDFNEVCWSDQMTELKQVCDLKDPRIGRGIMGTYNAHIPLFRMPIDHVLFCGEIELVKLQRLGNIGSDHFPLWVECQLKADGLPKREVLTDKEVPDEKYIEDSRPVDIETSITQP